MGMAIGGGVRVCALAWAATRAWAASRISALTRRMLRFTAAGGLLIAAPLAFAQLAITDGGTATYSFPIGVPPGVAGMNPILGLLYTGGGVNGPAGYGWSLQGVSIITRCPQTRAIDGAARSVSYTGDDKLCLDGQRLIQTDANGGVIAQTGDSLGGAASPAVHEYRTEKDSFARIRAYGSAGGSDANGPAYFKVWTKSGQIYEYGTNSSTTANATINAQGKSVVAVWAVSRVSDTLGNYIDFQYYQSNPDPTWGSGPTAGSPSPGHEWNLAEVRYTGNSVTGQQPSNKVVFSYVDRPINASISDRSESYHLGSKNVSIRLLDSIRTYVNIQASAIKVKTIKLSYDRSPNTGRNRIKQITECAGAAETQCMPPTQFTYSDGANDAYQQNTKFASSTLPLLNMISTTGLYGVMLGDFDGDGKTDILRWGNTASDNQLWLSVGDGMFAQVTGGSSAGQFNLNTQALFTNNGCYIAVAADFNGDGVADVMRTAQATDVNGGACAADSNLLFIGNGDGSFKTPVSLAGIDLSTVKEVYTSTYFADCSAMYFPLHDGDRLAFADIRLAATPTGCYRQGKKIGKAFHVLDVNGDGILDIVTTIRPAYAPVIPGEEIPTDDQLCAGTICTRVYLGNVSGNGGFTELTTTNLAHHSVYSDPPTVGAAASIFKPNTVDVDGDGLIDLLAKKGTWRSTGDGNFVLLDYAGGVCLNPIDFNGDGRTDCLYPVETVANSSLWVGIGLSPSRQNVAGFNLKFAGTELTGTGVGTSILDINADGRHDILRWKDDPTKTVVYLSNGNGTFDSSSTFNLNTAARQLRTSDGTRDYVIGDFTGRGGTEILRLAASPVAGEATSNQLYEKANKTPPDLLETVTSSSGLTTSLGWVPLSNPRPPAYDNDPVCWGTNCGYLMRYKSDRGPSNIYPMLDVSMPMYVVATSTSDTGVSSVTVSTEYSYAGLRGSYDGRGLLGFREVRRQSPGADGTPLTTLTQYLQTYPYTGTASSTVTYSGVLGTASPTALSSSTYTYCDKTAAAGAESSATSTAPCATTAKVQRPYLYKAVESGVDLQGAPLPTVTTVNVYDQAGNPTSIAITTVGNALGLQQTFTKTTTNLYFPDNTLGDAWVLGRLQQASQRNTVPNSLGSIGTTAGGAPNATSIQGGGAPPPISPAVLSIILQLLLDD